MLLDDTLEHLSGENSPPDETDTGPRAAQGSQTSFQSKSSSQSTGFAEARQKFGPTTKNHRPVSSEFKKAQLQSEDLSAAKHTFVRLKPTKSGKVGALASSFSKTNEPSETTETKRPPFAKLKPTPAKTFGVIPNAPLSTPASKKVPMAASKSNASAHSTEAKQPLSKLKPMSVATNGAAPTQAAATHAAASAKKVPISASGSNAQPETREALQAFARLKARASNSPPLAASTSAQKPQGGEEQLSMIQPPRDENCDETKVKNSFVQLKKVPRNAGSAQTQDTELSKIHLKRSTRTTPPVSSYVVRA